MKNIAKNLLTQEEREQLVDLVSQIENIVRGKFRGLTAEERKRFGSIKQQNKLLVNEVRDYRNSSPSLSSPDVDWDEFESDYEARLFLESLLSRFSSLIYQIEGGKILHDYDNYSDSRKDYAYAQYKNKSGEDGYEGKIANLKQLFNRSGTGLKNKHKNNEEDNQS